MSEETNVQDHNDGTWSGLKKTIVGVATTAVMAGKTVIINQAAPAQAAPAKPAEPAPKKKEFTEEPKW